MPDYLSIRLGNPGDRQCFRFSESLNNKLLCVISMKRVLKCLLCYSVYFHHIASVFVAYPDVQISTSLQV